MTHRASPSSLAGMKIAACLTLAIIGIQLPPGSSNAAEPSIYDLTVRILPDAQRIDVSGTWTMPAHPVERRELQFVLSPKMEGLKVRLVEPSGSLELKSAQQDGGDMKWVYEVSSPIPAGVRPTLQVTYTSDTRAAPQFRIAPAGSLAGGGGELWYPQTAYKDRETGRLRFIVPPGQRVISNGRLASTAEQQAAGTFVFEVSQPSKFGFASGNYTVVRREGRVAFNLYLLRPRPEAATILDGAARALDVLTTLFGPFPYGDFSLVEVDFPTVVTGTSEFGFILADDSKLDAFDLAYWAHEIGHQWWGVLVRSASGTTGQMMLSEGITQFGALSAVDALMGAPAAGRFRREGFEGKGQSAAAYFQLVRDGKELPLTTHVPKPNETLTMHRLANTRGFILLDMLSRHVGREAFSRILRGFIQQHANGTTSWQDFKDAVHKQAGRDVEWIFTDWFERTGAPEFQLTWKQGAGVVHGTITQGSPAFRAPLELRLEGSGRSVATIVNVAGERTAFSVPAPFKVTAVTIDPEYKTLRWLPEFRAKTPSP